jgi:hypothetical protein
MDYLAKPPEKQHVEHHMKKPFVKEKVGDKRPGFFGQFQNVGRKHKPIRYFAVNSANSKKPHENKQEFEKNKYTQVDQDELNQAIVVFSECVAEVIPQSVHVLSGLLSVLKNQ